MSRPRLTSGERRELLLDAAAVIIVERGTDALTMERLAAESGVSKALPYQHFENADDVLSALRMRELEAIGARVQYAVETEVDRDLESIIRAGVHAYFDALAERGPLLVVLAGSDRARRVHHDGDRRSRRFLADVFAQAVDLPRSVGDVAAAIVLAALPGAVDSWVHRRAPRREIEETLTLMITGGVALVAARLPAAQPAVP